MGIVVYDDFTRGEFGDLGPRLAGQMGPGWFTGKNVMRYRDGFVGPRPGLRQWSRSGSFPNGSVRSLYGSTNATESTFVLIGQAPRTLLRNFGTLELTPDETFGGGTIPVPGSWPINGQHRTDGNWLIVPGQGVYKCDMTLNSVVLVDGDVDGKAFKFFRDRQLAAGSNGGIGGLTFYSGPGLDGWDTFDDYFIGTTFNGVSGYFELRNGIVVAQDTNLDFVTGTIGTSSAVLRRVSTRTNPMDPYGCVSVGGEFLVIMGRSLRYPTLYNGATWDELKHLPYAGDNGSRTSEANGAVPAHCVVDLEFGQSWMILSGIVADGATNRMLLDWDQCRTFHTWGTTVAPYARRFENGLVMLTDGGSSGAPPEFYAWFPDLNRPGFTSDAYSQPGDDSDSPLDAYMHFPEHWDQEGKELLVRGVIIDFRKWATGAAETNHFDVTVEAYRAYDGGAPAVSTVQSFDEAGVTATADGSEDRVHMHFGDQGYGGGFRVKVDAIRGCAVKSVVVLTEELATRI